MTLEADLVSWAATRPDWQRDVLARLCRSQEPFGEAAIAAIADRLIASEATPAASLTAADIPGSTVAGRAVQVEALRDLAGVNALAPDQVLTFSACGLTVIYGDNGSGKSGYARVLRTAAGSRVREEILCDVFETGSSAPQSAVVGYRVGGTGPEHQWKWPGQANPHLGQVHFYDEACGTAYLGADSEISYRPSALTLFDQLIAVCDAVRGVLEQRLRDVDAGREPLPAVASDTPAARFLSGLDAATSDAQIAAGCTAPPDASEALGLLLAEEARLKTSDPVREQARLISLAESIESVFRYCDQIAALLTPDAVAELANLRMSATGLRAAATMASSRNFDAEPVAGVGSATWRALWTAARAFSEHDAYHGQSFPVTGDGTRCVLCHQELNGEAGDRLRRFRHFMTDTTENDAARAESALNARRQSLQFHTQVPAVVITALAQVRSSEPSLAEEIDTWTTMATARAAMAVSWLEGTREEPPGTVTSGPGDSPKIRARHLREQAAAGNPATFAQQLRSASEHAAALQAQIALAASKAVIIEEVQRLRRRARIEAARKATDTGAITRKSSELTRDHVTREVRDQFTRESERLRLHRITLDHTSGVKGRLLHRPALLGAARSAAVTSVLSEGEQTALGLSGFFTEVTFDATKSALVLDDPVTSLDHGRRSLVAQRLVDLAADRQVIVFTHEVTFVGDLVRHATEAKVPVTERWVQRNGDVLGVCADKHPWKARDVAARIQFLGTDLAAIRRDKGTWDQEQYEERCAAWGGKLSEAWERAINLEIVNEVVDRGTSQVKPLKFRILASITEQDNNDFQAGYGRCSEWARRHDKDPCVNFVAPEPSDMGAELERFRNWCKRIKGYRS